LSREAIAKDAKDSLSEQLEDLKQAYDDAVTAREDKASWMAERNEIVDEYDPKEGPPQMPEEPQSTDDSSNQGDQNAAGDQGGDQGNTNAAGDANQGDTNQGDTNQGDTTQDDTNQGDAANQGDTTQDDTNQGDAANQGDQN